MKRTLSLILCVLTLVFCLAGCGKDNGNASEPDVSKPAGDKSDVAETTAAPAEKIGIHHAKLTIKDYGVIELELDGDTAPVTVQNFMNLAKAGFYDGLTFHRIMEGFMMQGGDPEGTGFGGSDNTIKGEFTVNGVENNISHKRGVISMAKSQSYDSASSQFFICHQDSDFLDGQYAAFGHVTSGIEVVDKICKDAKPTDSNGTIPANEQPVIEKLEIVD